MKTDPTRFEMTMRNAVLDFYAKCLPHEQGLLNRFDEMVIG
jgi:hypothetical protein